jgi:uncharacterized protein YegP (UPF0339 family)
MHIGELQTATKIAYVFRGPTTGIHAMLRYRITRDENGRYFVLRAFLGVIPISETYATRAAAQETADWLNKVQVGTSAEMSAH